MIECNKKFFKNKKIAKIKKRQYENTYKTKYYIYRCGVCNQLHLTTHFTLDDKEFYRNVYKVPVESKE